MILAAKLRIMKRRMRRAGAWRGRGVKEKGASAAPSLSCSPNGLGGFTLLSKLHYN
jgi:hypothetical protein